jgi:hypothetical protein
MDKDWITELYYTAMGIYKIPERMGVRFRDESMFVRNVLAKKEAPYVEHPAEEEIYRRIDRGRLLVVRGPKGDGISMAVHAALVKKMLIDRAVVVDPIAAGDCLSDMARLSEVVDAVREAGREPIFYIDVSKPGHYPQRPWREDALYMPTGLEKFERTLDDLMAVFGIREVTTVVVLSDDLYGTLRDRLKEHVTAEVGYGGARFLRELAQTYSGCGEDVAAEVAEAAAKHDCGRAVLTALASDWLAQRNCDRGAVAEALKAAEEKAKKFYVEYIWRTVLNEDRPYANLHAPLILLRHFEGPVPVEAAEEFLIGLGFEWYKVRNSTAVRWLAERHCGLIEDAIKNAVATAMTKRIDEQPYRALRSAIVDYYKHFKARGYFK